MGNHRSTFDSMLDLCRNRYRRIVLGMFAAERRSVTLDDLTRTVLKYNHHTTVSEAADDVVAEIRTALHHTHLPKLSSEGLISHGPDRKHIEATEQLEEVRPIVSTIIDADPDLEAPIRP